MNHRSSTPSKWSMKFEKSSKAERYAKSSGDLLPILAVPTAQHPPTIPSKLAPNVGPTPLRPSRPRTLHQRFQPYPKTSTAPTLTTTSTTGPFLFLPCGANRSPSFGRVTPWLFVSENGWVAQSVLRATSSTSTTISRF